MSDDKPGLGTGMGRVRYDPVMRDNEGNVYHLPNVHTTTESTIIIGSDENEVAQIAAGERVQSWKNWGDHPVVVAIMVIAALIAIIVFVTGAPSISALLPSTIANPATIPITPTRSFELARYQELFNFAYSKDGIDLNRSDAIAWTESNYDLFTGHDLRFFIELFNYAYSKSGLDMPTKISAAQWAQENFYFLESHDYIQFKKLVDYAYSRGGLDMKTKEDAAKWALRQMGK